MKTPCYKRPPVSVRSPRRMLGRRRGGGRAVGVLSVSVGRVCGDTCAHLPWVCLGTLSNEVNEVSTSFPVLLLWLFFFSSLCRVQPVLPTTSSQTPCSSEPPYQLDPLSSPLPNQTEKKEEEKKEKKTRNFSVGFS
jgi:hypothetical protein